MASQFRTTLTLMCSLLGLATASYGTSNPATRSIQVVASIQPLSDIIAGVMDGVGTPKTLVPVNSSPHTYQLKPSQAALLHKADIVFWFGPQLEGFLPKILKKTHADRHAVRLINPEFLQLLPLRTEKNWEGDDDDITTPLAGDKLAYDPHVWLSPENAKLISQVVAEKLGKLDPAHTQQYLNNSKTFALKLDKTKALIHERLKPVEKKPYIVFHDGYQYFEKQFHLSSVGSITLNPEEPLSAKRFAEISQKIEQDHVKCIFKEPQFSDQFSKAFEEKFKVHVSTLDPLGQNVKPDAMNYLDLLTRIGANFSDCLSQK